jgi:hypothetical protein
MEQMVKRSVLFHESGVLEQSIPARFENRSKHTAPPTVAKEHGSSIPVPGTGIQTMTAPRAKRTRRLRVKRGSLGEKVSAVKEAQYPTSSNTSFTMAMGSSTSARDV